ncbi:MAG: CobD/CbiB family protein [Betaproteobacteria bacterium]|nr:CobD/CbiB family protein [Betaproteobacteria bacterium]
MTFFSLVAALLIEQLQALDYRRFVHKPVASWADFLERKFNGGDYKNGVIAWAAGVFLPAILAGTVFFLLRKIHPLAAWVWNVLLLYLTLGFRQFSHYYTDIHKALQAGDVPEARRLLAEWRGRSDDGLASEEIARLAIEEALAASHRHVFGVLVAFVLLPGPCGAVLYRLAAIFSGRWQQRGERDLSDLSKFGLFARQAFFCIDWLPLRVTALSFAVVGDFEDAVFCWRTQAVKWTDRNLGIVLASGAGALGVRLGMPLAGASGEIDDRAELGLGDEADADFMQSATGLVWRAVVLWFLLLLLTGLSSFG